MKYKSGNDKMRIIQLVLFTILVLSVVSCEFNEDETQNENNGPFEKVDQEQGCEMPYFDYSANMNGQNKFIKFYQDSLVWGHDNHTFTGLYGTSREMDDLQPWRRSVGYDVKFSKNYIIVGHYDDNLEGGDNLFNSGVSKMFFSLNSNCHYFFDRIYSINYNQEFLLLNTYDFKGELYPEFPLVISKFPNGNGERKYQIVELPLNNDEPNKITRTRWNDNELVISYLNDVNSEEEKIIKLEK